jgi:hypothetical protein
MRFVLFFIFGVILWAGTVSIKFPEQSSMVTASSGSTCQGKSDGDRLMEYLTRGTITSILDNGRILTIGLSPEWGKLPPDIQEKIYDTVACYAQSQRRPFQFLVTH